MWNDVEHRPTPDLPQFENTHCIVEDDQDPINQLATDEATKRKLKVFMTHVDTRHR